MSVNVLNELFEKNDEGKAEGSIKNFKSNIDLSIINKKLDIGIVGIGNGGCDILNTCLDDKSINQCYTYALNTDISSLVKLHDKTNVYLLGKDITSGKGCNKDDKTAIEVVKSEKNNFEKIIIKKDIYFFLSGLGGGTCNILTPELCKEAKEKGALVISILIYPSSKCGSKIRSENALSAIEKIKENSDSVYVISEDKIIDCNNLASYAEVYLESNKHIKYTLKYLLNIFTNPNSYGISYNDIENFFKNNKNFITLDIDLSNDNIKEKVSKAFELSFGKNSFSPKQVNGIIVLNIDTNFKPTSYIELYNSLKEITCTDDLSIDKLSKKTSKSSCFVILSTDDCEDSYQQQHFSDISRDNSKSSFGIKRNSLLDKNSEETEDINSILTKLFKNKNIN